MNKFAYPASLELWLIDENEEWVCALTFMVKNKEHLFNKMIYLKTNYPHLTDYRLFLVIQSKVNTLIAS